MGGVKLTATTAPAVTTDSAGIHFTANGAAFGAAIQLFVYHAPSGTSVPMTGYVGKKITGIVGATSTP